MTIYDRVHTQGLSLGYHRTGSRYAKRSLMSWVVIMPKEGRARRAAPALLLVWHRLKKKKKTKKLVSSQWQRLRTLGAFSCNTVKSWVAQVCISRRYARHVPSSTKCHTWAHFPWICHVSTQLRYNTRLIIIKFTIQSTDRYNCSADYGIFHSNFDYTDCGPIPILISIRGQIQYQFHSHTQDDQLTPIPESE